MNWQDKSDPPRQPVKEMVDVAKGKGEGWVEYMWYKPGEKAISKKISYKKPKDYLRIDPGQSK